MPTSALNTWARNSGSGGTCALLPSGARPAWLTAFTCTAFMPEAWAASVSVSPPAMASSNLLTMSLILSSASFCSTLSLQRRLDVVEALVGAGHDLGHLQQHPAEDALDRLAHAIDGQREGGLAAVAAEIGLRAFRPSWMSLDLRPRAVAMSSKLLPACDRGAGGLGALLVGEGDLLDVALLRHLIFGFVERVFVLELLVGDLHLIGEIGRRDRGIGQLAIFRRRKARRHGSSHRPQARHRSACRSCPPRSAARRRNATARTSFR